MWITLKLFIHKFSTIPINLSTLYTQLVAAYPQNTHILSTGFPQSNSIYPHYLNVNGIIMLNISLKTSFKML